MGVIKHSPTLISTNSRSFPYLLSALAVALASSQAVAAAPLSKSPQGRSADQPTSLQGQIIRLFLRWTSSLSTGTGSSHQKRGNILSPSTINSILAWAAAQNGNGNGNGNGSDSGNGSDHSKTTNKQDPPQTTTPVENVSIQIVSRTTAQTPPQTTPVGSQAPNTSSPNPPPPTQTGAGETNTGTQASGQVSGALPSGGNPAGGQQGGTTQPLQGYPHEPPGFVTTTVGGGGQQIIINQSGPNKALVIGLVISLVFLAIFGCLAAAWFIRRSRKRRREREQISSRDDTAPWIRDRDGKPVMLDYGEKDGYSPSPRATVDSSASLTPSAVSQVRARTPGGSPASPIPYNPSEISDDVSAHFVLLPEDHKIGVPVPFPLALHVPSRVVDAMTERDQRWREYELQRQMQGKSDDYSETSTIPRPPSRMPNRRSTLRSVTSSGMVSSEAYTGMDSPRNSRRSTWEGQDYFSSENDRSRYEVAANEHRNSFLHRGGHSGRSSVLSDFPTPPPPSLQQTHRRDGSHSSIPRVRRLPLPSSRMSNDGFPFPVQTESPSGYENPFLTDPNANAQAMSSISERSSIANSDEVTEEVTPIRRASEVPVVGAVTGVARSPSARTVQYLGRTRSHTFGNRPSHNPFDDNPLRYSAADSIATETVDTHQIHKMVSGFPSPPDLTQRPLL